VDDALPSAPESKEKHAKSPAPESAVRGFDHIRVRVIDVGKDNMLACRPIMEDGRSDSSFSRGEGRKEKVLFIRYGPPGGSQGRAGL
jgi:hypothetical protein